MNKKSVTVIIILILAILIVGTVFIGDDSAPQVTNTQIETNEQGLPSWTETSLTNLNDGSSFTLLELATKPLLIETFAVWCPTCTSQQNVIKALHEENGDEFVSISLDIDPSEEEQLIQEHTTRNGFTWRYAISPPELTKKLIEQYGNSVANAPSAPVILLCPDGKTTFLRRGVKKTEELKKAINSC